MKHWARVGAVIGGGVAGAATALVAGHVLWNRASARTVSRLGPGASATEVQGVFSLDQLAGLPTPVVRYFNFALTPGQPLIRHARLRQVGLFARSRGAWLPFTALEDFVVQPPGFVWDARIRMAPLLSARVRDSYVQGAGAMYGKLAALVPLVDQHGTPEMAASSLLRYLAEASWIPTALLPSAGVRWEALDDRSARATLTDAGTTVSIDVHFGQGGEIARVSAERYRDVDGKPVLTPWVGHFRDYAPVDRMRVPIQGEVGWMLPDGSFPYWRGRIVEFTYKFTL